MKYNSAVKMCLPQHLSIISVFITLLFAVLPNAYAGWFNAADLGQARGFHTANLLQDGRVLIAGGRPSLTTAEIYDPSTDSWSFTSPLNQTRHIHQSVILGDGRVFVIGGATVGGNNAPTASTEIYDPSTNSWSFAAPLNIPRTSH